MEQDGILPAPTSGSGGAPSGGPTLGGTPSASPHYEPLLLNLTGSPTLTSPLSAGVSFDDNNSGFAIATGWAAPGQGILVYDPSGGSITNGSQLFGTSMKLANGTYALSGFQALAQYDSNGDGVINASDPVWSSLKVWVNSDGTAGSGQLLTLAQAGISAITLGSTAVNSTDAAGNQILATGSFTWAAGGTGQVADVNFLTDPTLSVPDTTVTVSASIAALPDLRGYGTVTTLQQAMAQDSSGVLEGLVQQFLAATTDTQRDSLVDQIIVQWAGAGNVSPASGGSYFNGQELAALEKFTGQTYVDPVTGAATPSSAATAAVLAVAYGQYHDQVYAGLMAQTVLAPLFEGVQLSFDSTTSSFTWDFSAAEATITADLASNRSGALTLLSAFNRSVHALGLDTGAGYASFRTALAAEGADVAATFPYGTAIVQGTVGDDTITAWAGNQTVYGNGGNDTLIGSGNNETFWGGGGNTTFIGGVGNNEVFIGGAKGGDIFIAGQGTETFQENAWAKSTFIYDKGDGVLNIHVFAAFGYTDTLMLGGGLTAANISFNGTSSGSDILISDGVAGDLIDLEDDFLYPNGGVRLLEFADGSTLDLSQPVTLVGSSAEPVLYGTGCGGDIFVVGAGGETLYGRAGKNVYSYVAGSGQTTISDTAGNDTLSLGNINRASLTLTASGTDLLLSDGVAGDQIDLRKQLSSAPIIQTLEFADGSSLALNGLSLTVPAAATVLDGTGGNDTLTATAGAETLYGNGGNDTFVGGQGTEFLDANLGGGNNLFLVGQGETTIGDGYGSNIYSYAAGDGLLTIEAGGGTNTLVLAQGIARRGVTVTASGTDLLIGDGTAGDQITVAGQLTNGNPPVQMLKFADGSTISLQGLSLSAPAGVAILNGTPGNDTLTATSGAQTLIGNGGGDTFGPVKQ